MKQGLWHRAPLLFFGLAVFTIACCCGGFHIFTAPAGVENSENPPATFQMSDLVGTWEADYSLPRGHDELALRADGTFKQIYKNQQEDYVYETPWNEWSVERFSDGRVYVHLKGARYYLDGIPLAEKEGLGPGDEPWSYYDPFDPKCRYRSVHMVGELVLNIRVLPSGELVLANMWGSSESPLGDIGVFHRAETSSPPQTLAP